MRNYFAALLFLFVSALHAQDVLVKVDSSRIQVKVITVTDKVITYKSYSNQDGPVYEISRRYVARIQYENGTVERYGKTVSEELRDPRNNSISLTTTDLISGVITLNYEHTFFGKLGVRVTGSTGIMGLSGKRPMSYTNSYYYNRYKIFSAGLDIHYTYFQGRNISLYTGALVEFGQSRKSYYYWDFPPYGPIGPENYYFGGITNGIKIQTGSPLELDMFCTLGWRSGLSPYSYSDFGARFGLSLGYKF